MAEEAKEEDPQQVAFMAAVIIARRDVAVATARWTLHVLEQSML